MRPPPPPPWEGGAPATPLPTSPRWGEAQSSGRVKWDTPFFSRPDVEDLRHYLAWLREAGASDAGPLFPLGPPASPRGTRALSRQAASKAVRRLLAGVGVDRPGVAAHALRHAVGVLMQQATGNLRAVQARLHHSSARTSEVYAKVPVEDFRQAIDEIAAALRGEGST